MKVLLIAGHGDGDAGAVGNGYREADLTREVVSLLAPRLGKICETEVTDTSKDWFKYLKSNSYNFKPYDYVLEVHFNSGGGTGTEIYVTTSEKSTGVETAIVQNISSAVGYKNRGVKRTNFSVISKVNAQGVSAALLEVCFMDSASDIKTYQSRKNDIADAIVRGIAEGFGLPMSAKGHWAEKFYSKLKNQGHITDDVWKNYDSDLPAAFALTLLDKITGGTWKSDEADAAVHWAQPSIISLSGKGVVTDKDLYIELVKKDANLSNAQALALADKATGASVGAYDGKNAAHWGQNFLDSLLGKGIIKTPSAWENFDGAVTYGNFMALVCAAFNIV